MHSYPSRYVVATLKFTLTTSQYLLIQVDATILEVGVGGEYDCTNIVPQPVVTGISALGIDHTAVLGKTIREIGWQKAGIYKVRLCDSNYL